MSTTNVVIPIRGLLGGKSRLASHFEPEERASLAGAMASHVIGAVVASAVADSILVVSREADLLPRLRFDHGGVELLHQPASVIGLNAAIDLGRRDALGRGADVLLVLSADLPLLTAQGVAGLCAFDRDAAVVLGTDRASLGTNALVLRGHDAMSGFAFRFGPDSRRLHRLEAGRLGVHYAETRTPETAHDLDTPDDWAMLDRDVREHLLNSTVSSRRTPTGAVGFDRLMLVDRS